MIILQTKSHSEWAGGVAQVVELLPVKHETLPYKNPNKSIV
jgi:hypothetical protein